MTTEKYKDYSLYTFDDNYIQLGKDILDKNYLIVHKLKDTPRNFVTVIQWHNKKYILKEPRNEYRIPQRQLFSYFKDGESLSTLKNIHNLVHNLKFYQFIDVYLAGNKRKKGFIVDSFFVMEYVEGFLSAEPFYKDLMVDIMKKVHSINIYHGDCNPSNFIFDSKNDIHILDTKGKSFSLGNFRAHYDMITMWYDSYKEMVYPYPKNFWYYLAFSLKLFKRNKFISDFKQFKKKLRDRGWKI